MRITHDNRLPEILQLEHLLYGLNYEVWINTYGPLDPNRTLEAQLSELLTTEVVIGNSFSVTHDEARTEITDALFYPGDSGSGPVDLSTKRPEILALIETLFERVNLDHATTITSFWLDKGHPAYPVFWDFAFDIHPPSQRWIFMASSSD